MVPGEPLTPSSPIPDAAQVRCPECGLPQSAKFPSPQSFSSDPAKWLPACLVAACVVFQIITPWVLPNYRSKFLASGPLPAGLSQEERVFKLTRNELERAADADGPERRRVELIAAQFSDQREFLSWEQIDPAAKLTVGSWSPEMGNGFVAPHYVEIRGWPRAWRYTSDTMHSRTGWVTISADTLQWANTSPTRPGWMRLTGLYISSLVALCVGVPLTVGLASRLMRPTRRGSKKRCLRDRWWLIAVPLTASALLYPQAVPPELAQQVPIEQQAVARVQVGGLKPTDLTHHDLQTMISLPDGTAALARVLLLHLEDDPSTEARPASTQRLALGWRPETVATERFAFLGWPGRFIFLNEIRREAPAQIPGHNPAPRGIRPSAEVTLDGFGLRLTANGWPGTSYYIWLGFSQVIYTACALFIVWWISRSCVRLFQSRGTRARRRAARGLCTACGYDLKGLRQT